MKHAQQRKMQSYFLITYIQNLIISPMRKYYLKAIFALKYYSKDFRFMN